MRAEEKRPYYRPPQRIEPQRSSVVECILAVIGALFMVCIFIACIVAVGS